MSAPARCSHCGEPLVIVLEMDDQPVLDRLHRVEHQLGVIIEQGAKIMTASEDLKAAVAAEDATVDAAISAIVTYLQDIAGQISGGVSAEDAAAIVADLNDHAANLGAATANLVAVDPGAPVVPPVDGGDGTGDVPPVE